MRTRPRAPPAGFGMGRTMGSFAPRAGGALRPLVVVIALATVLAGLFVAAGPVRGALNSLDVAPGQYTGTNVYVPSETLRITVRADSGDVYDVEVFHWVFPFGTRTSRATFNDQSIPGSGERTLTWTIPESEQDSPWYWVGVFDRGYFEGGSGTPLAVYRFTIRGYTFSVWTDRASYLPGDTVRVSWAALQIKDGGPAPAGVGEIQVWDDAARSLITPRRYLFNASTGSFTFALDTGADPDLDANLQGWFNDTLANRMGTDGGTFDIDYLGVLLSVGGPYPPGGIVTVDVWAKITDFPGSPFSFEPGAAGARVNVTISDATTGNPTTYGARDLLTASDGRASHVFQLALAPTTGTYDVQASVTAHGVLTAATSDTFDVQGTTRIEIQLTLDRSEYVSGETARASVAVSPAGNFTYAWVVDDSTTASVYLTQAGGGSALSYDIRGDFTGWLDFEVTVNDGQGTTEFRRVTVRVALGYLAVSVAPFQFNAGETIVATFSLRSVVMTSPTYFVEVRADGTDVVDSGNLTGTSFSFHTPTPSAGYYEFRVTASDRGRAVTGTAGAFRLAGFALSITLDKPSYLPGETIRIGYTITALGTAALPGSFSFAYILLGSSVATAASNSPTGELTLRVPPSANEGELILLVQESSTGSQAYETVRIGSTNPLWATEIAGIPTFALLLGLLVALLVVVVLFLWRRVGAGAGPAMPRATKPTPPPPPAGPERRPPTTPMSVGCKNCGAIIEMTTSKRPIEVMCPSCGETQLVT